MVDYIDLALRYGGFTSLDKVYLNHALAGLTEEQRLTFITPPPSVVNAYFAEIYQKQSPEAATSYFFDLSCHLQLFRKDPSFEESKPFIRLNLSGKSFGFAYENQAELAQVFAEEKEELTPQLLFEIAQIFPHYKVFLRKERIYLQPLAIEEEWDLVVQEDYLLTEIAESESWVKISGLNQEEVMLVATAYQGQTYYAWSGREALLYIKK